MTTYDYSDESYSDLFKDCYGYRPKDFTWWYSLTKDEKQNEWNILVDLLARNEADRKESEAIAVEKFERHVLAVQGLGGYLTRKQAATSIVDAWMFSEDHYNEDDGWFEYKHGLPYGYLKGLE